MPVELLGHLVAAEALQRDPLDARGALELGEDGAQRVAAVQLVGAVGGEQEERLGARVADEEDEEVARGGVGPVQVLDHQRDGAEAVQQREQRLEHLRLARRVGHRLAERPQRLGDRRVGEGRAAELQAVADKDARTLGARLELRHQAALADARLAGHEGEGRRAGQRRVEQGQLLGAPDERGAGDAAEHDLHVEAVLRGERAHRPAPLARSRPGIGEEEEFTALAAGEAAAGAAEAAGAGCAVDAILDELGGDDSCVERVHTDEDLRLRRRPHIGRSRRPKGSDPLVTPQNPLGAVVA